MCATTSPGSRRRGVAAEPDDVVTSAQAAAALLAPDRLAPGTRVLACAGPGVRRGAARRTGSTPSTPCAGRGGRRRLAPRLRLRAACARAADGVRSGARFVATNLDPDLSRRRGPAARRRRARRRGCDRGRSPARGRGQARTRRWPRSSAPAAAEPVVMIGDRPSTDGAFAAALGVAVRARAVGHRRDRGRGVGSRSGARRSSRADLGALAPQLARAFGRAPPQ